MVACDLSSVMLVPKLLHNTGLITTFDLGKITKVFLTLERTHPLTRFERALTIRRIAFGKHGMGERFIII